MNGFGCRVAALAFLAIALTIAAVLPPALTPTIPFGHARAVETGAAFETAAVAFVDLFFAGRFEEATARFDSTMTAAAPPAKLAEIRASLESRLGPLIERGSTSVQRAGDYTAVFVTCRFEAAEVALKVVFDAHSRIAGFFVVPAPSTRAWTPPAYADTLRFTERAATAGAPGWPLPGTLAVPGGAGPHPAVVLVHGSGPNDRDETVGPNKPFRDLAWGLASRGIAVLRYEKRTRAHAARVAAGLDSLTVREETVDDAVAAVALLRETPAIDPERVFLLGHSLGGTLAPRIAERADRLAGVIVLAGAARPIEDLVVDQTRHILSLDGETSDADRRKIDLVRRQAARVKSPALEAGTPADSLPLGVRPAYWLDLRGYDPAAAAAALDLPILVLQGGRDYQVTDADFARWEATLAGRPGATLRRFPALNHLFMAGEGVSGPAEYDEPGHVDAAVVEAIARWIAAR